MVTRLEDRDNGAVKRGFVLGKFMPPHSGHVAMCRTAMRLVDQLTVMVCTLSSEPIPGALRARWMNALLPDANVVHYDKDIPQTPEDHPDFWPIWKQEIQALHPEPLDMVFGSEPYVHRLAAELGATPFLIDPARVAFPVSGSDLRADPAGHWQFLPGEVRPWYQKRLVTFGPESVGKSTLSAKLAARSGGPLVPEYGRTFDENRSDQPWQIKELLKIAEGHEAHRAAIAPSAGPVLVEDTDPLLTSVWAQMLLGKPVADLENRPKADLYLLLDAKVPFVQDGGRYFDDGGGRQKFFALCQDLLDRKSARYEVISGDWQERDARAFAAMDRLLAEPFPGRWTLPERFHPVHAGHP